MRLFGIDISVRKASEVAQETPALRQRVQRLEIALTEFHEHFVTLQTAHVKLRNQFHGQKGGRPANPGAREPGQLEAIPPGDKTALRRHFGIIRGGSTGSNSE